MRNPFTPGYARRPPVLAGRDDLLALIDSSASTISVDEATPPAIILSGARGVGKTVLLQEAADRLGQRHGWVTLALEAREDEPMLVSLRRAVHRLRAAWDDVPPSSRWQAEETKLGGRVAGIGAETTWRRQPEEVAGDEALEPLLTLVAEDAGERQTAVVLTVDEAHQLSPADLRALGRFLSSATGRDLPVLTVIAGLPGLEALTSQVTYLERARWRDLGPLDRGDTIEALAAAAARAGRPLDHDAADLLADASGGYPYAVQLYGAHAWDQSEGSSAIRLNHAQGALAPALAELATGLFRTRWHQATQRQQEYLIAVAQLQEANRPVTGRSVADLLGRTTPQVSRVRDELLRKGTLIEADGALGFPVPGLAAYVLERGLDVRLPRQASSDDDRPSD